MKLLFLYPQNVCYGIIHSFADNLSKALEDKGVTILRFDIKKQPFEKLGELLSNDIDAVIEFYSGLAGITTDGQNVVWDVIETKLFQVCLDYPVFISGNIDVSIKNHYVLCGDRDYGRAIKKYMPHFKGDFFFPMAGVEGEDQIPWKNRSREVSFIGTYNNYRDYLEDLGGYGGLLQRLGSDIFGRMIDDTSLNPGEAIEKSLSELNLDLSGDLLYQTVRTLSGCIKATAFCHRERLVESLVNAGIRVDVFGESWREAPFADSKYLVINDAVDEKEYMKVLSDSKFSLNLLYGNRNGITERYIYSMLNHSLVISDKSKYICEQFADDEDMLLFDLDNYEELPERIKSLVDNEDKALDMMERAYQKAKADHTWERRADLLMEIIESSC